MRWLSAALGALVVSAAGPASATAFVVNVLAPPTEFPIDERVGIEGSGSFPDVFLHVGDTLTVNVAFGSTVTIDDFLDSFVNLNVPQEVTVDNGSVRLNYPYIIPFEGPADGFSFVANVMQTYGAPDTTGEFDIKSMSYTFNPVPEPGEWGLLIAGMGAIGFALRQRRRRVLGWDGASAGG